MTTKRPRKKSQAQLDHEERQRRIEAHLEETRQKNHDFLMAFRADQVARGSDAYQYNPPDEAADAKP